MSRCPRRDHVVALGGNERAAPPRRHAAACMPTTCSSCSGVEPPKRAPPVGEAAAAVLATARRFRDGSRRAGPRHRARRRRGRGGADGARAGRVGSPRRVVFTEVASARELVVVARRAAKAAARTSARRAARRGRRRRRRHRVLVLRSRSRAAGRACASTRRGRSPAARAAGTAASRCGAGRMPYDGAREWLGAEPGRVVLARDRSGARSPGQSLAGDALRREGSLRLAADEEERDELHAEFEALREDGFAAEWRDELPAHLDGPLRRRRSSIRPTACSSRLASSAAWRRWPRMRASRSGSTTASRSLEEIEAETVLVATDGYPSGLLGPARGPDHSRRAVR